MDEQDNPLYDAERQMVEHELAAFSVLFRKVSDRLNLRGGIPANAPDHLTDEAVAMALQQAVAEDPEARELAERLAVLQRFRPSPTEEL